MVVYSKEPVLAFCLGFGMGVTICTLFKTVVGRINKTCGAQRTKFNTQRNRGTHNTVGNIVAINELENSFFRGIDRKARLTDDQLHRLKIFLLGVVGDNNVQLLEGARSLEAILHLLRRLNFIQPKGYRKILTILENARLGINVETLMFHVNGLEQAVEDIEEDISPRGFEQDVFELDVLILHTENDRREAIQFKEHLEHDSGVGGMSVLLYEQFNANKSMLTALGDVFNRTRYVFVFMTRDMEEDKLQQFMAEMALIDSFNDERKRHRIVPVWTTRERLNVPTMRPFPGVKYWQFVDQPAYMQDMYLTGLNRMLKEARETFMRTQ